MLPNLPASAATTPVFPEVVEAMQPYLTAFGNPSSAHAFGEEACCSGHLWPTHTGHPLPTACCRPRHRQLPVPASCPHDS